MNDLEKLFSQRAPVAPDGEIRINTGLPRETWLPLVNEYIQNFKEFYGYDAEWLAANDAVLFHAINSGLGLFDTSQSLSAIEVYSLLRMLEHNFYSAAVAREKYAASIGNRNLRPRKRWIH